MIYSESFQSPVGEITVFADESFLREIRFSGNNGAENPNPVTNRTVTELREYFDGKRKTFTVPFSPQGTDFQKRVWSALCTVPYGKTVTYGDIARKIGNEKAYRAVGNANGRNPIPIIIPCHRIVASDGIGGYSSGLEIKRLLLKLENVEI